MEKIKPMQAENPTTVLIQSALQAAFQPTQLRIQDDSAKHAGHAGAREGGGHFHVVIESSMFAGQTLVRRHRQIYTALKPLMGSAIHALAIEAIAPGET
jgi:BolA family transcriptional regulator, general stress-responsive regulator